MGYPVKFRTNNTISSGLAISIVIVVAVILILGAVSMIKSYQVRQPQDPADRDISVLEAGKDQNQFNAKYQVQLGFAYYTKALKIKNKKEKQSLFEKALAFYKKALDLNPKIATTRYNIGLTYEQLNKDDEAIKVYEELYAIEGGYSLSAERLGVLYMKKGETDKAIEKLKKAVEVEPGAANFRYELATAYEKKGQIANAIAALKIAVKFDPENKEIKDMLNRLEKSGKK
jgi:tetratricopeptide (TPR) repeat protein